MSNNLDQLQTTIESQIPASGAPGTITGQNHQNILKSVLSNVGKYAGIIYTAIADDVPDPGFFSWENTPMNTTSNFTVKFAQLDAEGQKAIRYINQLNQGDIIKFKDYVGRVALLEYQTHAEAIESGKNIINVTVKGVPENPAYAYNGADSYECVFEFVKNVTNNINVSSINELDDVNITSVQDDDKLEFDAITGKFVNRNIPVIEIITAVDIDTTTKDSSDILQKGRAVLIDNGANDINYTVNAVNGFAVELMKKGDGKITFIQGPGRTLIILDGSDELTEVGSIARIFSIGLNDYLTINKVNAIKEPTVFSSAASANFFTGNMFGAKPWDPKEPLKGAEASYFYNCWIFNDIDTYDIFVRYKEKTTITGFIYAGWFQFANMGVQACEVWAVTNPAYLNTIENFGAQAVTTNLVKIWDSDVGSDPTFPVAVEADYWDFLTDAALNYSLPGGPVEVYGLVFRPKTNHGHATRSLIYKLLFY